jgi:branched-chain amino acid transport system substrate-binding protein
VRRIAVLGAVASCAIAIAACGSTGSDSGGSSSGGDGASASLSKNAQTVGKDGKFAKPIILGGAIGKTGLQVPFDGPPWNGIKLAVDDINKDGGIYGQKIEMIDSDTTSTVPGSRKATLDVLDKGAALTFQTCNYDLGVSGATAAVNAGAIAWSLCAANPKFGVQGIGPTAYTPGVMTFSEGNVDAKFGAEVLKKKTAYALCDTFIDYSIQTCQGFKESAESYGVKIVGTSSWNSGKQQSIASILTKIKSTPDVGFIYLPSTPPGSIGALKQIRGAGIDLPVVSPTASYGLFWAKTLPNLNDYYIDAPAQVYGNKKGEQYGGDPRPAVNAIVKRYVDQYGKNPDHGNFLEGYASMQILADAIKATKSTDGKTLSKWIDSHGAFETVLGPKEFTPELHVNPDREFIFVEYKDTWPVYKATLRPTTPVKLHLGE